MAVLELLSPNVVEELVARRRSLDKDEAEWLELLGAFVRSQEWALEGFFNAAHWLGERCAMARATAYEKLRVACELAKRPLIADAFRSGELSYSHARILTRISSPGDAIDEIFIEVARRGSVRDLEFAVRHYQLRSQDDEPLPRDREMIRGTRFVKIALGITQVRHNLTDAEAAEYKAVHEAFLDRSASGQLSEGEHRREWHGRRADAAMEMARAALAAAGKRASGADRYMTHVVVGIDDLLADHLDASGELIDGTPIDIATIRKLACDSTQVAQFVRNGFEPLDLGRKVRSFSDGQRRAARRRDRGTCRIPGCENTYVDIHHIRWASEGGPTDIANAMCCCDRHHTQIHKRELIVEGDANATLTVRAADGRLIGFSDPSTSLPRL